MTNSSIPPADNRPTRERYAADDQIDLVDLGASLLRRWKLILTVIVICTALGVVLALRRHHRHLYSYTASIQLARYAGNRRGIDVLMDETAAKTLLENGLLDVAIGQYAQTHKGIDVRRIRIAVKAPKRSGVVLLVGRGPAAMQSVYDDIERATARLLRNSLSSDSSARAAIEARYNRAKLKLEELQDTRQVKVQRLALKQSLLSAQARLARLKHQHDVLKQELSGVARSRKLDQGLSRELQHYLTKARANNLAATKTKSPVEAMTAMLLGNQVEETLHQLTSTEERLTVGLPKQEATTRASLANNEQQQALERGSIEKAKIEYDSFDMRHKRAVESQQLTLTQLKARLADLPGARLVGAPVRTKSYGGLRPTRIVAVFALLGVVLAMLAVAFANYFSAVRARLAGDG